VSALADVAAAIGETKGGTPPVKGNVTDKAKAIAKALTWGGERNAILLGNAAAHHANASSILALANWIGERTGATVGYLTEAANTVGAQLVNAMPGEGGLNAGQMLTGSLKAVILLNNEPEFDSAAGRNAKAALEQAEMVVSLSPFRANMDFADVVLPIAPWTETPGTFVNAEGRVQSFHAVVKPAGDARPAWKVLRVLGNMLGLQGFDYESSQEVLVAARGEKDAAEAFVQGGLLSNKTSASIDANVQAGKPVTAAIYQLDSIVRRAPALQLTADARTTTAAQEGVPA
jgi:NADH-quinone oxidoreductase subunit G